MTAKIIGYLNRFEELFVGYTLLLLALAATIQVLLRYIFNIAFDWMDEGSRYIIILITFVGAGICVRYGTHFSMDALVQFSPNRLKHVLKALANLIATVVMAIIAYFAWIQIGKLHRFEVTTPSLQIPMFIPYLPIGIFTIVIALRFGLRSAEHINGFLKNLPFEHGKKGGH